MLDFMLYDFDDKKKKKNIISHNKLYCFNCHTVMTASQLLATIEWTEIESVIDGEDYTVCYFTFVKLTDDYDANSRTNERDSPSFTISDSYSTPEPVNLILSSSKLIALL